MLEYHDIVAGDVPVGDRAHLFVPDVIAGQRIVVVEIVLCAFSRNRFAIASVFRPVEPEVELDQLALRSLEFVQADMPMVGE